MFSNEAALGNTTTAAQIFIGHNSKYIDIYGVATACDLPCTLEENIMNLGAMDVLVSNNAHTATNQKVKDILCIYHIKYHISEHHHQHQNYTECCIGHIKHVMNHVLTFTHAPNNLWSLCLIYVVYILNITANNSSGDISPHQYLHRQTPDTFPTLCF